MEFSTILASLRRNPLGAVLIVTQVAITLAILLNAVGIVRQHVDRMTSRSGVDEAHVFSLVNRWIGQPTDSPARVARDLGVMRGTPGVVAAVSSNGVPLSGRGWGVMAGTRPVAPNSNVGLTRTQLYYFDEQGATALGLRLLQGRWFTAEEATPTTDPAASGTVILAKPLADHLFPDGQALGKLVYTTERPNVVIGVVDTLQSSQPGNPDVPLELSGYSIVMPQRMAMAVINNYIVRTQSGDVAGVMREVERRLREAEPMRVITELRPFTETRYNAYKSNRTLTVILVAVSSLLVLVTALGITGLASYWVAQRQRMIGVRRALGARRVDILAYFHSENLLIVGVGVLLGAGLALALSSVLVKAGVPPISSTWLWSGALLVLVIGQLAVVVPALRAARVPPALAMRSG